MKQARIFVVDDEPVIASTLQLILSGQGFDVTAFTDPIAALQAIQAQAPDFLIVDVVMPEISGIELAIVMREHYPNCRVLLFSGQLSTFDMLETARDRGHDFEVLSKPVHPVEMLERLRMGLELDPRAQRPAAGNQIVRDRPDPPGNSATHSCVSTSRAKQPPSACFSAGSSGQTAG